MSQYSLMLIHRCEIIGRLEMNGKSNTHAMPFILQSFLAEFDQWLSWYTALSINYLMAGELLKPWIQLSIVVKCMSHVRGQGPGLYLQVALEKQKDGSKGLFLPR